MSSSFELWRAQMISEIPPPFRGSFSIFSWGFFLVVLSFRASSSPFVCRTSLFTGGRALPLGYEGFLAIYIFLFFGEYLGYACLRVLRDGKH